MSKRRRGPGPSHVLITPDHAGNVVGVDPHKRSLSATVVDPRGGIVASEHFRVSGDGHRGLQAAPTLPHVSNRGIARLGPRPDCWPARMRQQPPPASSARTTPLQHPHRGALARRPSRWLSQRTTDESQGPATNFSEGPVGRDRVAAGRRSPPVSRFGQRPAQSARRRVCVPDLRMRYPPPARGRRPLRAFASTILLCSPLARGSRHRRARRSVLEYAYVVEDDGVEIVTVNALRQGAGTGLLLSTDSWHTHA